MDVLYGNLIQYVILNSVQLGIKHSERCVEDTTPTYIHVRTIEWANTLSGADCDMFYKVLYLTDFY